jgi:hypothetical protein
MQLFAIVEAGEVYARAARLGEALEEELAVVPVTSCSPGT